MTVHDWLIEFEPLRNPERPKVNGPRNYKECLFDMRLITDPSSWRKNKNTTCNIWSLVREDGKQQIVDGLRVNDTEGYFITKKRAERPYIIDEFFAESDSC